MATKLVERAETKAQALNVTITPNFLETGDAASLDVQIMVEKPNVRKGEVLVMMKLREGSVS